MIENRMVIDSEWAWQEEIKNNDEIYAMQEDLAWEGREDE